MLEYKGTRGTTFFMKLPAYQIPILIGPICPILITLHSPIVSSCYDNVFYAVTFSVAQYLTVYYILRLLNSGFFAQMFSSVT